MKIAAELKKHTVQSIHAVRRGREVFLSYEFFFFISYELFIIYLFLVTFSACSKCLHQIYLATFFAL